MAAGSGLLAPDRRCTGSYCQQFDGYPAPDTAVSWDPAPGCRGGTGNKADTIPGT